MVKTPSSGWLYTWAWAIQKASKNQDAAAKFITWASGKDYEQLVGKTRRVGHRPGRQAGLDLLQR